MIGKAIEYYREQRSMTKTQLSESAGISLSSITQYEKGNRNPSAENLQAIADALGYKVEDIESMATKIRKSFEKKSIVDDYLYQKYLGYVQRNNDFVIELTDFLLLGIDVRIHDVVHELSEKNKNAMIGMPPIRRKRNNSSIEAIASKAVNDFLVENLNEVARRIQDEYYKTGMTVEDIIDHIRNKDIY